MSTRIDQTSSADNRLRSGLRSENSLTPWQKVKNLCSRLESPWIWAHLAGWATFGMVVGGSRVLRAFELVWDETADALPPFEDPPFEDDERFDVPYACRPCSLQAPDLDFEKRVKGVFTLMILSTTLCAAILATRKICRHFSHHQSSR